MTDGRAQVPEAAPRQPPSVSRPRIPLVRFRRASLASDRRSVGPQVVQRQTARQVLICARGSRAGSPRSDADCSSARTWRARCTASVCSDLTTQVPATRRSALGPGKDNDAGDRASSRTGAEPLARQHHPRACSTAGTIAALHRRLLGDRSHLEPVHLRQGDRLGRLRRRDTDKGGRRAVGRGPFLRARRRGPAARRRSVPCPSIERTDGVDGWVSLEVSPLLAYDTTQTVEAAKALHAKAGRPNLFIKIPGTPEGLPAITEAIAAGVPVNVTLLFSADHYRAAAEAYLRRRRAPRRRQGLDPAVGSVASVFMSRWDVAVATKVPADLADTLGPGRRSRRVPCLPRADAFRPRPATPERGGPDATPAVGQHEDQGPRCLRHALCPRPGGTFHRQHDARRHPRGLLRPRRGRRPDARGRRRRRRDPGPLRRKPASTSRSWPPRSRATGPPRSSTRGTNCWTGSPRRRPLWPAE